MSQRRLVSLSHKTTHLAKRLAQTFSKQFLTQLLRTAAPTLVALSFAGISSVAHAQGTMDFSGAQTLMGTFKTSPTCSNCIFSLNPRSRVGSDCCRDRVEIGDYSFNPRCRVGSDAAVQFARIAKEEFQSPQRNKKTMPATRFSYGGCCPGSGSRTPQPG
jgi:hypothetical protein